MTRPAHSINLLTLIGAAFLVPPVLYRAAGLLHRFAGFEPLAVAFGSLPGAIQGVITLVCPALAALIGLLSIRLAARRRPSRLGRAVVVAGILLTVLAALSGMRGS